MRELWAKLWCRLGRPRCHRELRNGIDYAMCDYCGRQSEVHEWGGPRPYPFLEEDPFVNSPFNAETIRPGDPAWEIWERMRETGKPIIGTYDAETGEIIEMNDVDDGTSGQDRESYTDTQDRQNYTIDEEWERSRWMDGEHDG